MQSTEESADKYKGERFYLCATLSQHLKLSLLRPFSMTVANLIDSAPTISPMDVFVEERKCFRPESNQMELKRKSLLTCHDEMAVAQRRRRPRIGRLVVRPP